jgi:nicotinamidase-related amidase
MLNSVESVLVLVDFQGKLLKIVDRADLVLLNILRMVRGCQALEVPILPTMQVPEKLGPILPELAEALGDVEPVAKSGFSALREPEFMLRIEQTSRRQVILMGIEAHVCVLQTGMDLLDAGFEVHVLSDGVFSRTVENRNIALGRLHDAGAIISSVEICLFEMVRTSRHPQFKTISKLIK